jgi:hypothetical protein
VQRRGPNPHTSLQQRKPNNLSGVGIEGWEKTGLSGISSTSLITIRRMS